MLLDTTVLKAKDRPQDHRSRQQPDLQDSHLFGRPPMARQVPVTTHQKVFACQYDTQLVAVSSNWPKTVLGGHSRSHGQAVHEPSATESVPETRKYIQQTSNCATPRYPMTKIENNSYLYLPITYNRFSAE